MGPAGQVEAGASKGIAKKGDPFTRALFFIGTWQFTLAAGMWIGTTGQSITDLFFRDQDAPVLIFGSCVLVAMYIWRDRLLDCPVVRPPAYAPAILVLFPLVAAVLGTFLLFGNYALSRDEVLANFDADFFRAGILMAPLPVEWQSFTTAMMPLFMQPVPGDVAWVSGYLPGNAALRAATDLVIGKSWTNPILAAVAVLAVFRISRRLWPDAPRHCLMPPLLLATSSQLLMMAMTPYAMTAHLAFNLLWLWCFLRDDWRGDTGALAAGFVATGLHQIVFHPIFVAPFIAELLLARRWRRAGFFILGYGMIGVFWTSYKYLATAAASSSGLDPTVIQAVPQLAGQASGLLSAWNASSPLFIMYNLLRFAAWQHLLLIPLVVLSWPVIRRSEGIARPLAAGFTMMLVILLLLLPWQGHGWGYRYLHGFLGSFCLLAGYGWAEIRGWPDQARRNSALVLTTGLGLLVIWPFQMVAAHQFVEPYRRAQSLIGQSKADVVIVDATGILSGQDLVRNEADLSNTPKVMDMWQLSSGQIHHLCERYTVALFDRRHAAQAGIPPHDAGDLSGNRRVLEKLGCANEALIPKLPESAVRRLQRSGDF